jgi:hypothetical protein
MVQAQLGYAADDSGNGVAYARLTTRSGERLVRVAFRVKRFAGLGGREIGYAALTAVAAMLRERSLASVRFLLSDGDLVADLVERRDVPAPLVMPYVRLGCVLNGFASFGVERGEAPDLDGRARAELFLSPAA